MLVGTVPLFVMVPGKWRGAKIGPVRVLSVFAVGSKPTLG